MLSLQQCHPLYESGPHVKFAQSPQLLGPKVKAHMQMQGECSYHPTGCRIWAVLMTLVLWCQGGCYWLTSCQALSIAPAQQSLDNPLASTRHCHSCITHPWIDKTFEEFCTTAGAGVYGCFTRPSRCALSAPKSSNMLHTWPSVYT